jgi:hypothetical protein
VLRKIRRTIAMQGLMMSAFVWFGWKNRDAIERSVRAAREAWNEAGGENRAQAGMSPPSDSARPAGPSSGTPSDTRRVDVG